MSTLDSDPEPLNLKSSSLNNLTGSTGKADSLESESKSHQSPRKSVGTVLTNWKHDPVKDPQLLLIREQMEHEKTKVIFTVHDVT